MRRSFPYFAVMAMAMVALVSAVGASPAAAQVFTSTPNIPIVDNAAIEDTITVSGAPTKIYSMLVTIDLTHTYLEDLRIWLVPPGVVWDPPQTPANAPAGAIRLFDRHGSSSDNLVNTRFTAENDPDFGPAVTIAGSGPFTGVWIPNEAAKFSALYGTNPNGNWKLVIHDSFSGDTGTLQNWSLEFGTPPDPLLYVERTATIQKNGTDSVAGILNVGVDHDLVYTISNGGETNTLDVTSITLDLANATNIAGASVSAPSSFSLAPQDSEDVTISFEVAASGAFNLPVTIESNSGDTPIFSFTISGTAGSRIQLQRPVGTNRNHNSTDPIGIQTANQAIALTYSVRNDGADPLIISTIAVTANAGIGVIAVAPSLVVAAGDTESLVVELTVVSHGPFSLTLTLTHNAPGGTYSVIITGGTPLSGQYTVNNDPQADRVDFATLAVAFDTLKSHGVSGPVTFIVYDSGTPYTSTASHVLSAFAGMGPTAPVVVRAAVGHRPTVLGGGASSTLTNCGILLRGCQYVTIDGLTIDGNDYAANFGIAIYAAANVISSNNTIRRCFVTKTRSSGIAVHSSTNAEFNLDSTRIENNAIVDCRGLFSFYPWGALYLGRARQATVIFNTVIYTYSGADRRYAVSMENGHEGHQIAEFSNNLVYANAGLAALQLQNSGPESADRNLWFMAPGIPFGVDDTETFAQWQALGYDAAGVVADPLMRDPLGGDFELLAHSPARSAASGAFGVTTDFFGNPRPIGSRPDIGAHEFDPATAAVEIAVRRGQTDVPNNSTVNVGNLGQGVPMSFALTIENLGGSALSIADLQITNAVNAIVSVATAPAAAVLANAATTLELTMTAQGPGAVSFDVAFDTNDADEAPFAFGVVGTGVTPAPAIAVQFPVGTAMPHNSTVGLGSIPLNVPMSLTFAIANAGSESLELTGTPLVAATVNIGSATATIVEQPGSPLGVQATTTFALEIEASALGQFEITLEIPSNDPATPIYTLTLIGWGDDVPYIDATPALAFSAATGQADVQTVTIKNLGSVPLTVKLTSLYDPNGVFSLLETAPVNVGIGGTLTLGPAGDTTDTATLQIHFAPSATTGSPFSGTLTFQSNSGHAPGNLLASNTVTFDGTATTPPETPPPPPSSEEPPPTKKGCGITPISGDAPLGWVLLVALFVAMRRRRCGGTALH